MFLNCSALPLGKTCWYMDTNISLVSWPLGHSARNPEYQSWPGDTRQHGSR